MTKYLLIEDTGFVHVMNVIESDLAHSVTEYRKAWPDKTFVSIAEVADEQIPADGTFRNAWRHCKQNGVRHCMPTARNIHRDRMREKRKLLFSEVDAAFMRATMQGLSTAEIAAEAQKLRDVTKSPDIEHVETIEELKELWPLEVLGETPYVEPPAPPPQPKPFAFTADGQPLWSKREYNEYMAAVEAELAAQRRDEPEPVAVADEQYPQDYPEPPPVAPRATSGRRGDWKAAAAAVQQAEAYDAPLPEYVEPPPEPSAADVFAADVTEAYAKPPVDETPQQPARKLLREAVTKARSVLSEDRSDYDIAVMALHGNNEQSANLDLTAKRTRVPMEDVAREIIANWRGCERALTAVRELNEIALAEMVKRPGESHAIVNEAIALINEQVGNATAYRS